MKQQKNGMRILVVLATLGLSLWTLIPTFRTAGMSLAEKQVFAQSHPDVAAKAIKLGLDLQGGSHLVLEVDKAGLDEATAKDATDRALEVLRNRIDQFGVSEPEIRKAGDNRILVQLAGVAPEQAKSLLSSTAQLEFKLLREPADVKVALDRIDNALARGLKGSSAKPAVADTAAKADTAVQAVDSLAKARIDSVRKDSAAQLARSLFGGNQLAGAGKPDSSKAAESDTALKFSERAFTSLLVPFGNQIAAEEKNVEALKRLLARPEVKDAIRASESDIVWARKSVEVNGGKQIRVLYVLKRRAEMKGDYVADAQPSFEQGGMRGGAAMVQLTLKDRGPKEFARITGANVGKNLAIILDGSVYSAPVIQGRIGGGVASITGLEGIDEARQLAIVLRAGALPAPMHIAEERSVGPALGADNIKQGLAAAAFGFLAVFAFMVWQYHACGMIANVALLLNATLLLGILAAFHATLTLPGIAGVVLTVGMAVDSNVLIYERIREELRAGRNVKLAVDAGYKRAFSAIIDSHLTTVLTSYVLYKLGTGPIRGFGLTLTIGVIVSLFTALTCTRLVFDIWLSMKERTTISIGKGIRYFEEAKLNIVGNARRIGYVSLALGAIILVFIAVPKGKDNHAFNWSVDFTGGVMLTVRADGGVAGGSGSTNQITESLEKAGLQGVQVRTLSSDSGHVFAVTIKTSDLEGAKAQAFTTEVRGVVVKALSDGGSTVQVLAVDTVGPKIGSELKRDAFLAAIASLFIIMFYIWFRFGKNGLGYGVSSIVTLAHDTVLILGVLIVLGVVNGTEIDMTVVSAILTLIGYSLIDSIVIFDRIRENSGKYRKEDFEVLVNNSVNETLSRTIMTSVATGAVTLMLTLFGGPTLHAFALTLTIGIVIGTYSSIAVSSPVLIWWVRRRGLPEDGSKMPRAEMRVGQAPANSQNVLGG